MKRMILLSAALVAQLSAPGPETAPLPAPESAAAPAARESEGAPGVERRPAEQAPAAGRREGPRAGDVDEYMNRQPVSRPAADPDTGKAPEKTIQGLRFGTNADDRKRQGPRAR